jgi:hypothetical protein
MLNRVDTFSPTSTPTLVPTLVDTRSPTSAPTNEPTLSDSTVGYMERYMTDKPFAFVNFKIISFLKLRYRVSLHRLHMDLSEIKHMIGHATAEALTIKQTVLYMQSVKYAPEIGGVNVNILVAVPSDAVRNTVCSKFLGVKFASELASAWRDNGELVKAEQIKIISSYDVFPASTTCECVKGGWKHITHKSSPTAKLCEWYQEHCNMSDATLNRNVEEAKQAMKKAADAKHIRMMRIWGLQISAAFLLLVVACSALAKLLCSCTKKCWANMLTSFTVATDEAKPEEMQSIKQSNKSEHRVLYYRYCSTLPEGETMSYSAFCDSLTAEHTANAFMWSAAAGKHILPDTCAFSGGNLEEDDVDEDEYDLSYDDDDYEPIKVQRPLTLPSKNHRRRKCEAGRVYRTDKGQLVRWTGKGNIGFSKPLCTAHHRLAGECRQCSKQNRSSSADVGEAI